MGVPESSFAIAAFVVVALPGFLYAAVGRWARGESASDRDVGLTIARGAAFAVTLTGVYLVLFGAWLFEGIEVSTNSEALTISDPRRLGVTVLVFYIVVPAVISALLHRQHITWSRPGWALDKAGDVKKGRRWAKYVHSRHGYSAVPSAWDHAARQNHNAWVKIKRSNGEWVGGWFTKGSFVTTYPEPRAIYVADQFAMTKDGNFIGEDPLPGSGVFLMISDTDLVFWTNPKRAQQQEAERAEQQNEG